MVDNDFNVFISFINSHDIQLLLPTCDFVSDVLDGFPCQTGDHKILLVLTSLIQVYYFQIDW